jgi:hypothetical protein
VYTLVSRYRCFGVAWHLNLQGRNGTFSFNPNPSFRLLCITSRIFWGLTSQNVVGRLHVFGPIFNRISWVLARHNIKSVGFLHINLSEFLRPVKDDLRLRTRGVYSISCEVCKVYTGRSLDIRLKEYQRHIQPERPDKSAVAVHSMIQGHRILFHNASILNTSARYRDRIDREAIEVVLRPFNMNKEDTFSLSRLR